MIERELAVSGLSVTTWQLYRRSLRAFETWRAGRKMSNELAAMYQAALINSGKGQAIVNRSMAAVRWWIRRARELHLFDLVENDAWALNVPFVSEKAVRQVLETSRPGLSENTRRLYKTDVCIFEAWRTGRTISINLVAEYQEALRSQGLSRALCNRRLAAARWWVLKLRDLSNVQLRRYDDDRVRDLAIAVLHQAVKDASGKSPHGQGAQMWLKAHGLEWLDMCGIAVSEQRFLEWLNTGCPRPEKTGGYNTLFRIGTGAKRPIATGVGVSTAS